MNYDIAIIGGGPAGYTAAERAAEGGLKTVLFEKNAIGGVCLNEGCIPTKTLLYSAKILDSFKTSFKYGISPEGTPSFDMDKIIRRKNRTVKKLTSGVKMRLTSSGITIVEGTAVLNGETDGMIRIQCGNALFTVKNVLLCTGSETVIPPIKGLSDTDYWTSREALDSKELPKELMPEILGAMDKEASVMLRSEYAKKGVEFHLNTKVTEVNPKEVIVEKDGKTNAIPADKILVSVGRRAITKNLGLESLSIETDRRGVRVNEYMQTSHPHVYAAGDITGFSQLAHTAYREGEVAVNHILGNEERMDYRAIPAVVYTNPEVAGVGKTEEELKASGEYYNLVKIPMTYSGRFVAENEIGNGLCKLLTNVNGQIIGCHLVGNPASEIIVIAGIAVEHGYTVDEFKKTVFPHPTIGEAIHESLYL